MHNSVHTAMVKQLNQYQFQTREVTQIFFLGAESLRDEIAVPRLQIVEILERQRQQVCHKTLQ